MDEQKPPLDRWPVPIWHIDDIHYLQMFSEHEAKVVKLNHVNIMPQMDWWWETCPFVHLWTTH